MTFIFFKFDLPDILVLITNRLISVFHLLAWFGRNDQFYQDFFQFIKTYWLINFYLCYHLLGTRLVNCLAVPCGRPFTTWNSFFFNSQAVGLNSWVQFALKSILTETLFLNRLHDFSLLSSNSFLHPFWNQNWQKKSLTPKKF